MGRPGELWRRLRFLFRRRQFERDLEEELRFHTDSKAEAYREAGVAPEEARYAARRGFGNRLLVEEHSREAWAFRWLEDGARDLRYACRSLRRNRGFSTVAVLTLALGIGVNTAMFSVLYGTCLAPLDYAAPERLVDVSMLQTTGRKFDAGTSLPNLREWQAQSRSFEGLGAHRQQFFVNLTGHGDAEEAHAWRLSAGLLRLLGVPPLLGRWFVPEEDGAYGPRSALIAHALWQSRFGGDPQAVGRQVFVDGEPYTIVGVMPPRFAFPPLIGTWDPVIWLSLNLPPDVAGQRDTHSLSVVGRLKRGVSLDQAQAEMDAVAGRLANAYPKENGEWPAAKVSRLRDIRWVKDFRSTLRLLLGAAGLVLLIACFNVANLLMARGTARAREFAVRKALGVSRGRLARQLLTESAVIAALGCALGVLLAYWSLPVLRPMLEGRPRVDEIAIRPAVLVFAAAIAGLTGIVFSIWPAFRAANIEPALRRAAGGGPARQRLRKTLVSAEIGIGLMLLSGAGLLLESFWRATHAGLGFQPEHILTMRLNLPRRKYDTGRRVEAFREELLRRASALPGVEFAGTNSAPPMGTISQGTDFQIEGKPDPPGQKRFAGFANVSSDYLRAMGIPVVRGRNFEATDRPGTIPVAIVSESVARRFLSGEEVIGRRLRLARLDSAEWFTVVGVAGDVRQNGPATPLDATIYALSSQLPEPAQGSRAARLIVLTLRTRSDPSGLARAVRAAVGEIDKDQPLAGVMTMRQAVSKVLAGRRLNTLLISVFAGLAVALAAIGVFGLVSYSVTCRTNEIGIRMALGARRSTILAMVARETLVFGLGGVAAGLAGSLGTSRLLAGLVYGVRPAAPHVLVASAALLVAAMLLATLFAARRAVGLDPVTALRHE